MRPSKLPPTGYCIYCGSTRYSEFRQKLGDEHIVPLGLNGDLILPQSSCSSCERIINRFETFCQSSMLESFRYKMGIRGRKRGSPKRSTGMFEYIKDGMEFTSALELKDYPVDFMLPWMPLPVLLRERSGGRTNVQRFARLSFYNEGDPIRILDMLDAQAARFRTGSFNTISFARMIAKIAHSIATYAVPRHTFTPLLLPIINGKEGFYSDFLVGCSDHIDSVGDMGHDLFVEWTKVGGTHFLVCRIRLFTGMFWPEYVAVAGVEPSFTIDDVVPVMPADGKLWGISNEEIGDAESGSPIRAGVTYINTFGDQIGGGLAQFVNGWGGEQTLRDWRTSEAWTRPDSFDKGSRDWRKS